MPQCTFRNGGGREASHLLGSYVTGMDKIRNFGAVGDVSMSIVCQKTGKGR